MEKVEIKTINSEIAEEWLKKNLDNRPLDERVVADYARQMREGRWHISDAAIVFDEDGRLTNGQHRLSALCQVPGLDIKVIVATGISKEAFKYMDTGKKRTGVDIFNIEGIAKAGIVVTSVKNCLILRNVKDDANSDSAISQGRVCNQELHDEYLQHQEIYNEVARRTSSCRKNMTSKYARPLISAGRIGGYMAHLIINLGYEQEKVFAFFSQLAEETETTWESINLLRTELVKDQCKKYDKMTSIKKEKLIVKAWNSYSQQKTTRSLQYREDLDKCLMFM